MRGHESCGRDFSPDEVLSEGVGTEVPSTKAWVAAGCKKVVRAKAGQKAGCVVHPLGLDRVCRWHGGSHDAGAGAASRAGNTLPTA